MTNTDIPHSLIDELQVKLHSVGYSKLGQEWNYSNITSPFSRIYLIEEGEGYILPNNVMYQLKPGYLYLIPSFVMCSYHCVSSLAQYYLHLSNQLPTGLNIYDLFDIKNEVKVLPYEKHLFDRLIELNKESALLQSDPKTYEGKSWRSSVQQVQNSILHLETIGILKQMLSRFLTESKTNTKDNHQFVVFRKVFQYINSHLDREIRIEALANLSNYSYDHFIRVFKKTTGMLPMNYINMKRIEKAQILLLTTNLAQKEICDQTGFNHLPYYYRVFQKQVGCTPSKYRKEGGLV